MSPVFVSDQKRSSAAAFSSFFAGFAAVSGGGTVNGGLTAAGPGVLARRLVSVLTVKSFPWGSKMAARNLAKKHVFKDFREVLFGIANNSLISGDGTVVKVQIVQQPRPSETSPCWVMKSPNQAHEPPL